MIDFEGMTKAELIKYIKMYEHDKINENDEDELIDVCKCLYMEGKPINKKIEIEILPELHKLIKAGSIFTNSIKRDFRNPVKKILSNYGNWIISGIVIKRTPVVKMLERFLNVLSFGKFSQGKNNIPYDDLFHLYSILTLTNPETKETINLVYEKNDSPNLSKNLPKETDKTETYKGFLVRRATTLQQFVDNAIKVNPNAYFIYRAYNDTPNGGNCQKFLIQSFEANGYNDPDMKKWVLQDIRGLVEKMPKYAIDFTDFITDMSHKAKQVIGLGDNIDYCTCE